MLLQRQAVLPRSYSGGNGSCVEVADLGEHIAVRDSKDRSGPKLVVTRETWRAFLDEVKTGKYVIEATSCDSSPHAPTVLAQAYVRRSGLPAPVRSRARALRQ